MEETTGALFVRVAIAKGVSTWRAQFFHALPAAISPIVTVAATQLGALLGGAVVLEKLFERNGLGSLLIEAYASRDIPVLEATVVTSGLLFVAVQTVASLASTVLDPRAREVDG
jgi:peptide/nickel transport system permease protein